jgi:hypothetical protein
VTGRLAAARVLRFGIGFLLLATSVGKLLDLGGFARVLNGYEALPQALLVPAAVAITALELVLAGWLLSGRRLAQAAAASAVLHGAYAAWSALALARGLRIENCGCFGVFWARPLTWMTVVEDLVVAGLSVTLSRLAPFQARVA